MNKTQISLFALSSSAAMSASAACVEERAETPDFTPETVEAANWRFVSGLIATRRWRFMSFGRIVLLSSEANSSDMLPVC